MIYITMMMIMLLMMIVMVMIMLLRNIVMMIVMIVVRSKMMIMVMMVITRFWPSDDGDERVDEGLVRFKGAEVGGITFLTKVHEGEIVTSH